VTIFEMHAYLGRARRDLWAALESVPEEVLAGGAMKDLVFHIVAVQDGWLHEDILRVPPLLDGFEGLDERSELGRLLEYWRAVEMSMLGYLEKVDAGELERVVEVHDAPTEHYRVGGLLWHVMVHEVRHTAQIVLLLRQAGIKPPALDLLFYLPQA
jgi:uncharacterized damage-inducible protein DinB